MPDLLDRRRAFGARGARAATPATPPTAVLSQQAVHRKTVTRVETAAETSTMERMRRLADALDLDARELLRREPEAREPSPEAAARISRAAPRRRPPRRRRRAAPPP